MFLEKPIPKKKRKGLRDFFDFRNSQMNQIGLILFSAFVISTSLFWLFEERFDAEQWRNRYASRYKMAEDLIDSELFINKTQEEVFTMLGEPDTYNSEGKVNFIYYLAQKPSFFDTRPTQLIFRFKNNRVIEVVQEDR